MGMRTSRRSGTKFVTTSILFVAIYLGQARNQVAFQVAPPRPCAGISLVTANRAPPDERGERGGEVHYKISNHGCPPGTRIEVSAVPGETTGNIRVTSWVDENPRTLSLPAIGLQTPLQTIRYKVTGYGSMKFQVVIIACNEEKNCDPQRWWIDPESRSTDPVNFP